MCNHKTDKLPLAAAINATAAQLDIAAEDAEQAINRVLDSFDAAAGAVETLETVMNQTASGHPPSLAPEDLLGSVVALRKLLRQAVVDLQFQDRLVQRLAMATRELRTLSGNGHQDDQALFQDGAVPKSAASLYDRQQLARINEAAGQAAMDDRDDNNRDDNIELF